MGQSFLIFPPPWWGQIHLQFVANFELLLTSLLRDTFFLGGEYNLDLLLLGFGTRLQCMDFDPFVSGLVVIVFAFIALILVPGVLQCLNRTVQPIYSVLAQARFTHSGDKNYS